MKCGLSLGMILSVRTCWFHNTATQPSWLVSTDFGTGPYQCSLILPLFPSPCQSVVERTLLSCLFMCYYFYHNLLSMSSPCILLFSVVFDKLYQNDENCYSVCRSMVIIIYEPLPLILFCVLFRKAVTTGFAIINCRFKTLERHMVDFIGYSLPRLASRSSFWTKSEISFKSQRQSLFVCLG